MSGGEMAPLEHGTAVLVAALNAASRETRVVLDVSELGDGDLGVTGHWDYGNGTVTLEVTRDG